MPFAEGTPTTTIRLGGQDYTLGWTWAAKKRVRDHLSAQSGSVGHEEEYLSAVLWASMDKESRATLSLDDVAEMINPSNESTIAVKIRELCGISEPPEEPDEGNAKPLTMTEPVAGG